MLRRNMSNHNSDAACTRVGSRLTRGKLVEFVTRGLRLWSRLVFPFLLAIKFEKGRGRFGGSNRPLGLENQLLPRSVHLLRVTVKSLSFDLHYCESVI